MGIMGKLEGKVAVVTGGTTGIGLATAKRFHAEGARVFVTGTNPETLDRARAELGDIAEIIASDAGDADAVRRLFARVAERAGGLDVLFLNAGILGAGSIVDMPEDAFDAILRINVKGPWLALKAAIPLLRRGGAVVLNGSINGHLGMPGTSAYAASKGALRSLARVAASELAPRGVRVNVVSPGPTSSGILEKLMGREAAVAKHAELADQILLGRMGATDEIAAAVVFLASGEASFITGEELVVDGGMTRV
jgi:NAD(P)-dependent dehydrogenase (short-subunit alcohol dehydrogenase family)